MTEPEEEPQEPLTTVEPLSTVEPEPETEGAQFLPENTGKNPWNQGESSKNVGKNPGKSWDFTMGFTMGFTVFVSPRIDF